MTKYLDDLPFSSPANTKKYSDNYDKVFGEKCRCGPYEVGSGEPLHFEWCHLFEEEA